jgi:hypothetical protein
MDRLQVNHVMTPKALNRALLARQMLLAREKAPALGLVERLVGLQAQQARPPFVGLWSRLEDFRREELLKLLNTRKVVRATLMRATLHLMSARDYVAFRPALQPMLSLGMKSVLRDRANDLNLDEVLSSARMLFDSRPSTFAELRRNLAKAFPNADERAMGYAVRTYLPLVTTPDDSTWGFRTDCSFALAESWIGKSLMDRDQTESLLLRYLEAFGPATAADVKTWSGLQGAQPVLDALRPKLLVFRDERKRELFDLPHALRPEEDTPAPPRFVAAFDNLILSHVDRSRIVPAEHRPRVVTKNLQVLPTFLVDGFVAGTWGSKLSRNAATLTISPFVRLAKPLKAELSDEAEKLVRFIEPEAKHFEVEFA